MAEQILKSMFRINTSLPFTILSHRLWKEVGVHISLHINLHVEALRTTDPSLIKVDENLVAFHRAAPPPILKPFPLEPST